MSPVSVKVSGVWKDAASVHTKVSGSWKTAADMPVKVGGVWKTGILSSGSFESIATTTLSTATSTITFSSIPQTYQHLQIRFMTRTSQSTTGLGDLRLTVNGASSSYAWHRLSGDGSAVTASGLTGDNGVYGLGLLPRNGNTAGIFGVGIIDLLDYTSTTKNPTIRFFAGTDLNGSGIVYLGSGIRTTAAATTSFSFDFTGWNYVAGSTFALYGIRGA